MFRLLQRLGSAGEELAMYDGALRRGDAVVAVRVTDHAQARAVADLLEELGGARVQYFDGSAVLSV